MIGPTIAKGELHFTVNDQSEFICREMIEFADNFVNLDADNSVIEGISNRIETIGSLFKIRTKEDEEILEEEQFSRGRQVFDDVVQSLRNNVENMTSGQQFLFWLSDWWYYHPMLCRELRLTDPRAIHENATSLVGQYLLPQLPCQVQKIVQGYDVIQIAVNFGHFAIMFVDDDQKIRRIVTDAQLFEIHNVNGYIYLDILPSGKPVARSKTSRGGGRAFFDGIRLMSHPQFETCAPKTIVFKDGYKVNSTGVTLINGVLYPLIDVDDKVAHTHGVDWFLGIPMCEFSNEDALASYAIAEESAQRLEIDENGVAHINDQNIKPIGVFQPSRARLLDSGFALYEWSDFHEIVSIKYSSVVAVDDNADWLGKVFSALNSEIPEFKQFQTTNKRLALDEILRTNPDALLLDMHLTDDEEFDGLWIANQLAQAGFGGKVLITSGYPREQLEAMGKLIKMPVETPGKNIASVIACLTKRE